MLYLSSPFKNSSIVLNNILSDRKVNLVDTCGGRDFLFFQNKKFPIIFKSVRGTTNSEKTEIFYTKPVLE